MIFLEKIDPQWRQALSSVVPVIERIERELTGSSFLPAAENVLRVLEEPLNEIKVVIFGQDPYPGIGEAMGLAFSLPPENIKLPRSLQNIYQELRDDLGSAAPANGDLTHWSKQGVALVNRTLTGLPLLRNAHLKLGWRQVTDEIATVLGKREVVAILWGRNAFELAGFFAPEWVIASPHPSPLSAHRGFFGSRPFSRANQILIDHGSPPINWRK